MSKKIDMLYRYKHCDRDGFAGRVRLLDRDDNLIATREAGTSFGELTLFSEEDFQPYTARASVRLKLCYLPGECLEALIHKYPNIRDRLYHQAVVWDLLLLCKQSASLGNFPGGESIEVLSLLEQHNLDVGKLPPPESEDCKLWFLRRGELLHSSGKRLTPGSIHAPSQSSQNRNWQVTQPTELHILSDSDWETALHRLPQLAQLVESDTLPELEEKQRKIKSKIQNPKSKI